MKKLLAVGGLSLAMAALPATMVLAATTTSQTDIITITVSDNCELSRGSTAHNNGDGTWSSNTLSATRTNGTVTYNLGKSNFSVKCNNKLGYKVTVATSDLTLSGDSTVKIPAYTGTAYSGSVSGWSPIQDSGSTPTASTTKYKSGDTVKTESTTVNGSTFSVYYGVGISSTQAAGTYTNASAAVYTLTKLTSS